jgi:hypothetical protein
LIGVSRRKTLPLRTSLAASTIPSGVRKFTHPTSSSSPKTPQLESAGAPGLIGSCANLGILLKSIFAMICSPLGVSREIFAIKMRVDPAASTLRGRRQCQARETISQPRR